MKLIGKVRRLEGGFGVKQANLAREEVLCTGSLTQIQWDHLDTRASHSMDKFSIENKIADCQASYAAV